MFDGFSFDKLLIVAVIAAFLLGPDKLPGVAKRAAVLIKRLRDFSDDAKSRLRDELGDEVADLEWRRLDPRQYDPRRIIRDALSEPVNTAPELSAPAETTTAAGDDPSLVSHGVRPDDARK